MRARAYCLNPICPAYGADRPTVPVRQSRRYPGRWAGVCSECGWLTTDDGRCTWLAAGRLALEMR